MKAKYQAQAEVVAPNRSPLSVEVTGIVVEIPVDVASTVKAGDLLLRLNDTDLALELKQVEAQLTAAGARVQQAKIRLERAERLRDSEFISADDFLDRQTELTIQHAERSRLAVARDLANRRLNYARLTAPFDATVIARSAQVGQQLSPGQHVLTLVDLARPHVIANIASRDITTLKQASGFTLLTQRGEFELTLEASTAAIDPESRVSPARFGFTGSADLPGATGTVSWEVDRALVPVNLIVRRNGQLGIFVAAPDCPKFVILPGAQEGRPSPHNLPLNTEVITSGHQRLTDCTRAP